MGSTSKECEYLEGRYLAELKELINESGNLYLKDIVDEDDFLRTFLIGRKFNVQRAFETAKNHMYARNVKYRDIFSIPAEAVRHIVDSGFFGILKNRDALGRCISFMRIPKLDIKTMEFDEILRTAILMVDKYWYDRGALENGQIFIVDYSGYNLSIFTRYSFNQKLNFCMLFLNNYPTKFKSAHIYNNPKIVGYTYSLIKPFLPDKLKKRIFLHGPNKQNLLEHFSPNILPKWMGGLLTDEEAIDTDFIGHLVKSRRFVPKIKIME